MALYNEILVGRYNRLMQKLFSMKGGPPAPQLSSDLQMVMALFHSEGERYLEGWDTFGASLASGPVVGQNDCIRLRNPAGSGVLAEVFRWQVFQTAAGNQTLNFRIAAGKADLGGAFSSPGRFDARSIRSSTLLMSQASGVANTGFLILQQRITADPNIVEAIPTGLTLPLLPGDSLDFETSGLNVAVVANMWWRERPLEASEITA